MRIGIKTILSVLVSLATLLPSAAQKNHNFEVGKNLDVFNNLFKQLDLYYVDTINPAKLIKEATDAMLSTLDPYTNYFADNERSDLKQMLTGKYGGMGALIHYNKELKRCVIAEPFENCPATKAGLRAGDVILEIAGKPFGPLKDDDDTGDFTSSVSDALRGEPGTTFILKIQRPGESDVREVKVTREAIKTPAVTYYGMLGNTGYIYLSQFTTGCADEMRKAVTSLKSQGAEKLVIDLRGNVGGSLEEAVDIVNLFIAKGKTVVELKGKVKGEQQVLKTQHDPLDSKIPIAVLVNGGSASAAEIMAGTLQDYDRALIMGRRTYGKGLVQQSRELPYKGILKLTTGKYYIPSGRCVQAYKFEDGLPVHLPDSLAHEFRTAAGRIVRDGGGITPDVITPADSVPNLLIYLQESTQLFDYCVQYRAAHANIAGPTRFKLTDEEYADFCAYMKKHNFSYDRQSLKLLSTLRKMARFEGYETEAKAELDALESKLTHNEDYDFKRWEREIRGIVEGAIIEHFYYEAGREEHDLKNDKDVQQAVKMFGTPHQMHKILSGEPDA